MNICIKRNFFKSITSLFLISFLTLSIGSYSQIASEDNAPRQEVNYTGIKLRSISQTGFVYEYTVNPGEKVTGQFLAQHEYFPEDQRIKFYLLPSDYQIDPDTGEIIYPEKDFYLSNQFSLAKWIKFEKESITLNKYGEEAFINFTVDIPRDAKPGSYYASLILSNISKDRFMGKEESTEDFNGATVASRIAPVVIVTVRGDLTSDISVNSIDVLSQELSYPFLGIHEYLPVTIRTRLNNAGNFITRPSGNLFIHQGDISNPITTLKFNERGNRLLPTSIRPYFNNWEEANILFTNDKSFPGNGRLAIDFNKTGGLRIGQYFVLGKFLYKDAAGAQKVVELSTSFWVIPWKLILTIIVLISLIIYVYIQKNKQKKHRNSK